MTSVPSSKPQADQAVFEGNISWSTQDFLQAHSKVASSKKHNFEGCRIPIPTDIRYDRLQEALGEHISSKEERVLQLLKYGMPIDCQEEYGVQKQQKNHYSAVNFSKDIELYLNKNLSNQAMLGPFFQSPIPGLRFSPLMSVPKEEF